MPAPTAPASLLADLRALPRTFWILFAGTFINRFGTFVWPFLTFYLTRRGHSLPEVAWAVSAFGVGSLGGSVLGGWLADHLGRRRTIVLGTFASSVFFMLLYTASALPAVIVCTWLAGLANGTYQPASGALLADIVPPEHRVRAYAAIRLAANAGFAFGVSIGGILANRSLFWLFAGDALTTALYGFMALLWLPHGLRSLEKRTAWSQALAILRGDRAFHALWIAGFCAALIYTQCGSSYSLHVIGHGLTLDVLGWHLPPETVYGLLLGWNGALVVLAELPLTSATLRFDARRVMALGYALGGLGFAMNGVAHSVLALWIAMTVFTIGEMISSPTASAYLAQLAPEPMRGRYMGVLALSWNTAGIVGPQMGLRLFGIDPMLVWLVCGLLGLAAAGVILRAGRL